MAPLVSPQSLFASPKSRSFVKKHVPTWDASGLVEARRFTLAPFWRRLAYCAPKMAQYLNNDQPDQLISERRALMEQGVSVVVPESVRDYLWNRTIHTVVDHMLGQQENKLPLDLEWDDVRSYHEAWLAARKVKVDYAFFLMDLWQTIWLPALNKWGVPETGSWSMAEMAGEEVEPTLDRLWTEASYYRWYWLERYQCNVYTQVMIEDGMSVNIAFCGDTEDGVDLLAGLQLSEGWAEQPDSQGNRQLTTELQVIEFNSVTLDVSRLAVKAEEIIAVTLEMARTV